MEPSVNVMVPEIEVMRAQLLVKVKILASSYEGWALKVLSVTPTSLPELVFSVSPLFITRAKLSPTAWAALALEG